jgi:O-methyltransferase
VQFLLTRDRAAVWAFLRSRRPVGLTCRERLAMLRSFVRCTNAVRGYHTLTEMLIVVDRVLARAGTPGPTVVECGTGKGASTAKLSLAVRAASGRLIAFDSFRGIPANDERHVGRDGRSLVFRERAFAATLPSVRSVVERFGAPEVCRFEKGWFEETLPRLDGPVDVALLDVDLLSSTRTCLTALAPRMRPGGTILSHDGHIRAIADLLADDGFWADEVGVRPSRIDGLGDDKLVELTFGVGRESA